MSRNKRFRIIYANPLLQAAVFTLNARGFFHARFKARKHVDPERILDVQSTGQSQRAWSKDQRRMRTKHLR